ncbi:threonine--tRNA ligase [Candidatus Dojkabacteria bacterium]|nr:threonine--tRNA ligase [Candidatus Dojkabacteria bacterium]
MNDKQQELKNNEDIERMRHSSSHVLAQAVLKMFPEAKFGIGPAIENGFYYDFELPRALKEEDLPVIEEEMKNIIKQDLPIVQKMRKREDFIEYLKLKKQDYKLDLLNEIPDKELSTYVTGDDEFIDLCRGPHVESTGKIGAVKVDRIAGAYWRGDEKNPMLQRIYGLAFGTQKELDDYLDLREKLEAVDHRKLGKELDLFSFHEESPASAFWHPKGLKILNTLISYWREVHEREGYVEVRTPVLLTKETWKRSGHLDNFKEKMYMCKTDDSKDMNYAVKPMNCDGGMLIYKTSQKSYKDLPLKMGEIGVVHRYESSGETHGLMRVREFTQDDAHIYCTKKQVKDEIRKLIKLFMDYYKTFHFEIHHIELSTRPENSIGSDENWELAERLMKEVLDDGGVIYKINEGDGAFYGPKIDFHLQDKMGRTWQCGTIQVDFAQPENFELEYIDEDGNKQRPIMLHRVVYGSIERFIGLMIENYGGIFPLWLAPEQIRIVPIADRHEKYANEIQTLLAKNGVSATIDIKSETMQARIRDAELQKIPYVVVVGDKEQENHTVSVRPHGESNTGMVDVEEFINNIIEEISQKKYEKK